MKVAVGFALPFEPRACWHGGEIQAGYAHAGVDEVVQGYDSLELDIPGAEGEMTLGEVVHAIVLWPKKNIVFLGSTPGPPFSLSSHPTPPRRPRVERGDPAGAQLALGGLGLDEEKPAPEVDVRPQAGVALAKGGIAGECDKGVGRQMMRLEPEELQESAKERARRQPGPALKVCGEYHTFIGLRLRHDFLAGQLHLHSRRIRCIRRRRWSSSIVVAEPSQEPLGCAMATAVEEDKEDEGDGGGEARTMDGWPPVALERLRSSGVPRESLRRVQMRGLTGVRRRNNAPRGELGRESTTRRRSEEEEE
ncbi:hypothetical protein QYE76_070537 [Lolium multiflorum]|uniref:DUF8039 domain-containing protein n=1 Tax=Lolium multiflorum TaxID=4521 RepID=A0AAD8SID2_LOLMU|nr:hypothetical protein QYE76_070537 [Lolium multiflorum]